MDATKVVELKATSTSSFEDAIKNGLESLDAEDRKTIVSILVKEQRVDVEGGDISAYQVNLLIIRALDGDRAGFHM